MGHETCFYQSTNSVNTELELTGTKPFAHYQNVLPGLKPSPNQDQQQETNVLHRLKSLLGKGRPERFGVREGTPLSPLQQLALQQLHVKGTQLPQN